MAQIHPTAVVEDGAEIAEDAVVGPLCYVAAGAVVGPRCRLVAQATVMGAARLGPDNVVWCHAVLGSPPQDLKYDGESTRLDVGSGNDIREGATLHAGTANGGGVTRIGSHNLVMVGAHVAHDCMVGDHTILSNTVQLAGHVRVSDHAVIAGASAVHHFATIGQYAFVGGMTRIVQDVPPFMVIEGNPARVRKVNTTLLKRNGFEQSQLENLKRAFRALYGQDNRTGAGRTEASLDQLQADFPEDPCIEELVTFVRNSANGVYGRYREHERADHGTVNPAR